MRINQMRMFIIWLTLVILKVLGFISLSWPLVLFSFILIPITLFLAIFALVLGMVSIIILIIVLSALLSLIAGN